MSTAGWWPNTDCGTLREAHGVLADKPHSLTTVLVPGACLSAGADWRAALWPAAGAECMMAAADLFDDVADADPGVAFNPAVALTAAAGLLSLAGLAVIRVVEDGASPQLPWPWPGCWQRNSPAPVTVRQPICSPMGPWMLWPPYRQSAAKSGPLGSLIARLGARTATDDGDIVDSSVDSAGTSRVRSQLLNDARDAAPGAAS